MTLEELAAIETWNNERIAAFAEIQKFRQMTGQHLIDEASMPVQPEAVIRQLIAEVRRLRDEVAIAEVKWLRALITKGHTA